MKTSAKDFTPFPTTKYIGAKYFCDREEELDRLLSVVKNDRPLVLFSKRRMGKTGLVKHLHYHLTKKRVYTCIYVDVFNTKSDEEFVAKLVNASIMALDNKRKNFISNMLDMFSRYSPKFTMDPTTGIPGMELSIKSSSEISMGLNTLFQLLESQQQRIQISIDEFQQISSYESKSNIPATLREYMQTSKNVHFLFCGSQRHLLMDLFNNPKQPMYRMVDQMLLEEVDKGKYKKFILKQFKNTGRQIDEWVVDELLEWTRVHTFYVQVMCNKLYSLSKHKITNKDWYEVKRMVKKELEMNFLSYRKLLSTFQYLTLRGIAKEGQVTSVRTKYFTNTYNLASTTAQQSLEFLIEKEMVYEKLSKKGSVYMVYDLFLERWLLEDD